MAERDTLQVGVAGLLTWLEDAACLLDLPDTIAAVNQPFADLVQLAPEALCGVRLQSLLLEETDAAAQLLHGIALAGQKMAPLQTRIRGAQGKATPVALRVLACGDPARRLLALTPMETGAHDTMLQLQSIVDSAAIGIFFSQNRQFKRCNRRGEAIFGYEPDELLGLPGSTLYPSAESYEQLGRAAGPLLAAGAAFTGDWQFRRKDGELIWCRVYAKAIDQAHTERGTVWIFDDISEARAMQEALKQSLLEMEALMSNASVGILITRDRKMTRYNPMFGQMFGFAGDAGIGRPALELYRSEEEYRALGAQAAPLLSQAMPFQSELFMRRQDGSDLWVNLIGYVVDVHDPRRATFWILEDRSAFKAAESALFKAQHDLAQAEKMAALGALVVGVAHELNTPLGNALVAASTLHERGDEIKAAIAGGNLRRSTMNAFLDDLGALSGLVMQSCKRAAQLVTGFKQVAVGRRNDKRAQFRLADVLEHVVAEQEQKLGALPDQTPVTFVCDAAPDIVCNSYPDALSELLANLLENAVTHAFIDGRHGTVHIAATSNHSVELRVTDNGVGMDAGTLTRIFDPYFTTRLGHGRSGLGLPISRNLASAILGGELSAESQTGQGSCFILRFPKVAGGEAEQA